MNKIYYFALTLIFVSCNYSIPNIQNGVSGNQVLNAVPIGSIPSYQTVATAIFTPKCLSCHSSGGGNAGGVNLETYASVTSHLAAVSSSITSGSMPKNSAPLTAREKEILLSWIDAGGPLNAIYPSVSSTPVVIATPPPITPPTTTSTEVMPNVNMIDYKMVSARVLGLRCISCHSNSGGNRAGINLETYESLFNERSGIKSTITSGSMPQPTNRPLSAIQKQIILAWLSKGAPETVP